MQQQQQQNNGPDWEGPFREIGQNTRIILALAQILSRPAEIPLRKFGTWGERNIDAQMVLGFLAMPCFSIFFPAGDARPLIAAWLLLGVLLAVHRARGWWLKRKGYVTHSRYTGEPWIPGPELKAKQIWEPTAVLFLGIGVCFLNAPLGTWLVVAGLCLGLAAAYQWGVEQAALRAMKDARLMQQYRMERFRKEVGED